jgi:hypothetical protein
MLLEHGRCVDIAKPEPIGIRYLQLNFDADARAEEEAAAATAEDPAEPAPRPREEDREQPRLGDGQAEILESWFEDHHGERATLLMTGDRCAFCTRVRFKNRLENPLFGVNFHNSSDVHIWGASNAYEKQSGVFEAGDEVVFAVAFANHLAPDRYFATPAVADAAGGLAWHDRRGRFASVMVTGRRPADGLLELPFELTIEPFAEARTTEESAR